MRPETDTDLPHIGLVGDTYTIVLTGNDTKGRFCLTDMFVPVGGGPPPHRHDFEETFIAMEGEIHVTFRGKEQVVRSGETIHVPSNAPHQFQNRSDRPARMLCICSPAGHEDFFMQHPQVAPWINEFLFELSSFPRGKFDDWVDAWS